MDQRGGSNACAGLVRCIHLLNMSRYAADAGSTSIAGHVQ